MRSASHQPILSSQVGNVFSAIPMYSEHHMVVLINVQLPLSLLQIACGCPDCCINDVHYRNIQKGFYPTHAMNNYGSKGLCRVQNGVGFQSLPTISVWESRVRRQVGLKSQLAALS